MSGQSKEARTISCEIQKKDQWGEKNRLLNSGPRVELQRLFSPPSVDNTVFQSGTFRLFIAYNVFLSLPPYPRRAEHFRGLKRKWNLEA